MPKAIARIAAGFALAAALLRCGVQAETSAASLSTSDALYARANAECGTAPILRVLDTSEEVICCLLGTDLIPQLHCMKTDEPTVVNPSAAMLTKLKSGK